MNENLELEAKFLEINPQDIQSRLLAAGAADLGEDHISEIIFYDRALTWPAENKFLRLRKTQRATTITYKHDTKAALDGVIELEIEVNDALTAEKLFSEIGLVKSREQEKRRHSFKLGTIAADIDTWPKVPTYLELEGPSEAEIKKAASSLGLDWSKAVFGTAPRVIEEVYKIPVKSLKIYKFDRIE